MIQNPLVKLSEFGQSIWLDNIRRGMLFSGELVDLIQNDGLVGMTSNPTIFEKAIAGSRDYDEAIRAASAEGKTSKEIYEDLTISDVQKAADLFRPVFEKTKGKDGFVSLEVSPHLAHDSEGTILSARRLWKSVSRPNLLVKVPATESGLTAIRELISEGINVNVTLLFGLERYREVVEAYLSGLETRLSLGKSIAGITSVASFFLSRIDLAVDPLLPPGSESYSRTAIASAKIAFQDYRKFFGTDRFRALKAKGAATQRLLWASTSTKDPNDSDVKYVEALIGPETINTIPPETLNAYRDHGCPANRLETDLGAARELVDHLKRENVDLRAVTDRLEGEGVHKFRVSFDKLMTSIELKRRKNHDRVEADPCPLVENCGDEITIRIATFDQEDLANRLWKKDTALWKSDPTVRAMIGKSLGWLHIADKMEDSLDDLRELVRDVRAAGFEHVVHMGMGGSSLAPLVFARTFTACDGLGLTILDSTSPAKIKEIEESIPLGRTLFIVASKSGATAEPLAFADYFYEKVKLLVGESAGSHFVAITDPNTPLMRSAESRDFRRIFPGAVDIGGRYSALSYFGLVPAALLGVNVGEILARAIEFAYASAACPRGADSPAIVLGAVLGEMALQKKNKVTLLVDKPVEALGLWLEQLMAESTGKEGKGLIPIVNEPLGDISSYSNDRLFIHLKVENSGDEDLERAVTTLRKSGRPVVTLAMKGALDLGKEFFQWEFAVAVASSILGINAFDQPNVQESKENTDRLLSRISESESPEKPTLVAGALRFYSSLRAESGTDLLHQFLKTVHPGDYFALLAFLPEVPGSEGLLQRIRGKIRNRFRIATTLGYGPRYLHSTGQLHKGGAATGLFVQLTADVSVDVHVPGKSYTFGIFQAAQAQGDLDALRKHGRRVLRIHLGSDIEAGLRDFERVVDSALEAV